MKYFLIFLIGTAFSAPCSAKEDQITYNPHIYGNPRAPLTITVFSDFDCPYCRQMMPALKKYINESGGQARWIHKHFPLSGKSQSAYTKAKAVECVAKNGGERLFWGYYFQLFQPAMQIPKPADLPNPKAYQQCMDSDLSHLIIEKDIAEGSKWQVNSTPTLIFTHKNSAENILIRRAVSLQEIRQYGHQLQHVNR